MPIRYTKTRVYFEDRCAVEEALELVAFLEANPRAKVTLAKCTAMHSALLQVLMAFQPPILAIGEAPDMVRLASALTPEPMEHACPPLS